MSALFGQAPLRLRTDHSDNVIPTRRQTNATIQVPDADTALRSSAVWAAVRLKANLISSFDLKVFRRIGDAAVQELASPPVFISPDGEQWDMGDWLFASQVELELRGNTFGKILDRDPITLLPKQISLVPCDKVWLRRDRITGTVQWRFGDTPVAASDVWHERAWPVAGEILGLSTIAYHALTIGMPLAAQRFGADWFSAGAHPSAVLMGENPIEQTKAKVIKERFMTAVQGREPVVLGAGIKYQQIQVAANESQFLETMKYGGTDIARVFDVPADMLDLPGGGTSLTYSNREQRNLDFLALRMGPVLKRRERRFSNRLLPRGQWARFDTTELLRPDAKTRFEIHKLGVAGGWLTPTEVRAEDGRVPLTDAQKAELWELYEKQRVTLKITGTEGEVPLQ